MDKTEQQIIDDLFNRLQQAERGSGPRDAEAEQHIRGLLTQQPAAAYYMAQAIIVQEEALKSAQAKIEELESREQENQARGGSFLGGLFGAGSTSVPASGSVPKAGGFRYPQAVNSEDQAPDNTVARYQQTRQGGGFLAGAAQTAAGVAGGILVANMISDMIGGSAANAEAKSAEAKPAEEPAPEEKPAETTEASAPAEEQQSVDEMNGHDIGDYDDGGGFFDDFDI